MLYLGSQERIGIQAFRFLKEQQPRTTAIPLNSGCSIVSRWDPKEGNLDCKVKKIEWPQTNGIKSRLNVQISHVYETKKKTLTYTNY